MSRREAVREAELQRNLASGARVVYDPYPLLDELRAEQGAVIRGEVTSTFGLPPVPGMSSVHF